MEKSIEERAEKYLDNPCSYLEYGCEWETHNDSSYVKKAYIQGATDQMKIDIEKACELFRKECQEANKIIQSVCDRNIGDLINVDASVKTFRKKLEE